MGQGARADDDDDVVLFFFLGQCNFSFDLSNPTKNCKRTFLKLVKLSFLKLKYISMVFGDWLIGIYRIITIQKDLSSHFEEGTHFNLAETGNII